MLITFSGMVGSGKSTAARHIAQRLAAAGIACQYVRFRSIGLLPFRNSQGAQVRETVPVATTAARRWAGFRPRTLTAAVACGYAARILAYRLFGPRPSPGGCILLDRYFYDSFVHYKLDTRRERAYASFLGRLIPLPDLAILVVASPDTISKRRPDYAKEYVVGAGEGYDRLRAQFPNLIEVRTDPGDAPLDRLDALLRDRIARSTGQSPIDARGGIL